MFDYKGRRGAALVLVFLCCRRLEGERLATLARGEVPTLRDVYDNTLTGFGPRLRPDGSVSFVYRWSAPERQQKRSTGRRPGITVEEAWAAANAFMGVPIAARSAGRPKRPIPIATINCGAIRRIQFSEFHCARANLDSS